MAQKAWYSFGQWLTCVAVLVAFAGAAPRAVAADASVMVSATVLKHARLVVTGQPSSLEVTMTDVARGYVEVADAGQVAVRSNSSGYLLEFATDAGLFRQIDVAGLGHDVRLDAAGGVASRPAVSPGATTTMRLRYRFMLAASARPGIYAWPVRLSVTAL